MRLDIHIYWHTEVPVDKLQLDEIKDSLNLIITQNGDIMSKISDFAGAANAALKQANDALDNIAVDEINLAAEIQKLKDQITNSASTLTPEDQAALDSVLKNATDMASRTKTQADSVPDLPPVPPV